MNRRQRIALALIARRRVRFMTLAEMVRRCSPVDTPLLAKSLDRPFGISFEWRVGAP